MRLRWNWCWLLLLLSAVGCAGDLRPSRAYLKLSVYRSDATASLTYAAKHIGQIFAGSPRIQGWIPVSPRFGMPAFVIPGEALTLSYLCDGDVSDAAVAGMQYRLRSRGSGKSLAIGLPQLVRRRALAGAVQLLTLAVVVPDGVPPGLYDLVHRARSGGSRWQALRVPGSVSVMAKRADAESRFSFVHLTDLHQRKGAQRRVAQVVSEINRIRPRPAFVVLTGDIVNDGGDASQWAAAVTALSALEVPLVAIIGNHDYHHGRHRKQALDLEPEESGLHQFMRHFHPYLSFQFAFHGYRFLAIDTGSSATRQTLRQARWITTHGLAPAQLAEIGRFLQIPAEGHVILGHAPTRARLNDASRRCHSSRHAVFVAGAERLESLLLAAATRPVVYLSGHVHWNDLFLGSARGDCRFRSLPVRQRPMGSLPCRRRLPVERGPMLISTQSASKHQKLRSGGLTEVGLRFGEGAGAGFGFRLLDVAGSRWHSAVYRFYHHTRLLATAHQDGYIDPGAWRANQLPLCRWQTEPSVERHPGPGRE